MGARQEPQQPKQPEQPESLEQLEPTEVPFPCILERAKLHHDQTAMSTLYKRFLPTVYRYVLARVADVAVAEDLTSETFCAMIRGIASTRAVDELGFAAWLLGIARNQVMMRFRRQKIHPEVALPPHFEDDSQSIAEEGDPLLVLTARERWNETVDAINQLTEEQRKVILYHVVLGYSTEEVAGMMSRQPGAIRALQFRALASLARQLEAASAKASRAVEAARQERERYHAGR